MSNTSFLAGLTFEYVLSRVYTVRFFIVLYDCYFSDCTNMIIMSHCGISVVINVRLYDNQDTLKTCARKKTCPEFYIINSYTFSDCELHCTRGWNVGYHEKYVNGGNTVYLRRIV